MKSLTVAQQQKLINMVSDLTFWLWSMNDYDSREIQRLRSEIDEYIDKITGSKN